MPFGLSNAPSTFQRMMDLILTGLIGNSCLVYLDDIIIFSRDFSSHLKNLEMVFKRLENVNLKLKITKCKFLREELPFLGNIISKHGIHPDLSKIEAVKNFKIPINVKEIQTFLGITGYYRRFINDYADIAEPLTRMTRKDQPFVWNREQDESFKELKSRLISAPILAFPNFDLPFILFMMHQTMHMEQYYLNFKKEKKE